MKRLWPIMEAVGLKLNPPMCITYRIGVDGKRKTCFVDRAHALEIDGTRMPVLRPAEPFKFLAVLFSHDGIQRLHTLQSLDNGLRNLTIAPLKPQQRLFLLKAFLVHSLRHVMTFQRMLSGKVK